MANFERSYSSPAGLGLLNEKAPHPKPQVITCTKNIEQDVRQLTFKQQTQGPSSKTPCSI